MALKIKVKLHGKNAVSYNLGVPTDKKASHEESGLMSYEDKSRLDEVWEGRIPGGKIWIDESTNTEENTNENTEENVDENTDNENQ